MASVAEPKIFIILSDCYDIPCIVSLTQLLQLLRGY